MDFPKPVTPSSSASSEERTPAVPSLDQSQGQKLPPKGGMEAPPAPSFSGTPSMSEYVDYKKKQRETPQYTEDLPDEVLGELTKTPMNPIQNDLRSLGSMPSEKRAEIGAKFGAGIGMTSIPGEMGALIGASVGGLAARGIGMIQSGEAEQEKRLARTGEMLANLGVFDSSGRATVGDGIFNVFETERLKNANPVAAGGESRSVYERDTSNPYANRAYDVARSLAYGMSYGRMRHTNAPNDEKDKRELESVTGFFANLLTDGAEDESVVYERGRSLAKKLGFKNGGSLKAFLSSVQGKLIPEDVGAVKNGVMVLFPDDDE